MQEEIGHSDADAHSPTECGASAPTSRPARARDLLFGSVWARKEPSRNRLGVIVLGQINNGRIAYVAVHHDGTPAGRVNYMPDEAHLRRLYVKEPFTCAELQEQMQRDQHRPTVQIPGREND